MMMITLRYAREPLIGTPRPTNAHENSRQSSIHPTRGVDNKAIFTPFSLLSLGRSGEPNLPTFSYYKRSLALNHPKVIDQ